MKWIVVFGLNLSFLFQSASLLSYGNDGDNSIPTPPCCHSECCCSHCPRDSCLRPPDDPDVLHPCSCNQELQYSCSRNSIFPTLLPFNYPLPQMPYPLDNSNSQYPIPRSYVISPQRPPIRPFLKPNYMKPCLCGTVAPTCQQMLPCGVIGNPDNSNINNNNNNNNNFWYTWDFSFLETPQGIALIITAIVLLLLILCLLIGLIIACFRTRSSHTTRIERDYERQESWHHELPNEIRQEKTKK